MRLSVLYEEIVPFRTTDLVMSLLPRYTLADAIDMVFKRLGVTEVDDRIKLGDAIKTEIRRRLERKGYQQLRQKLQSHFAI